MTRSLPTVPRSPSRLRFLFAGAFAITCVVHLVAVVHPGTSPLRHALFAGINGVFATLFARGARWVFFPLVALSLQQAYSHGADLVDAARHGTVDVQSAAVLVFLPLALAYAWRLRHPSQTSKLHVQRETDGE